MIQIDFKQNYEFEEIGSTENNKKIYVVNPEALYEFAKKLGINVGVNVESVMAKRAEIEASLELTHKMRELV